LISIAGWSPVSAQNQETVTNPVVNMTIPVPPIPFASTGGVNIVYELELISANDNAIIPEKFEVIDLDSGKVIYSPDTEVLTKIFQPAANPLPTIEERMNGTRKLSIPRISIWFKVDPDSIPDRLIHRLTMNQTASGHSPITITGGEVGVRKDLKPVVLGSPLKGSGWFVQETTEPTTHHFLMPITVNNTTTVDQRYAQDWNYIDPKTGDAVKGNATIPENILGYGKELYAVSNGRIVDIKDGIPDNEIFTLPPFSFENGPGNYVIIDIGNNLYACYMHLIPGSLKVKKGDIVKEGDIIGLLGNSGMSDFPHLHFEVVTGRPSIIGGEGYPFVFRSFDQIGYLNMTLLGERSSVPNYSGFQYMSEFGIFVKFLPEPIPEQNKMQENMVVVRFP